MLSPEEPTFGSKHSSRAKLRRSSISILRPILDERHFEENYQSVERKIKFSVPEPIRSAISPPSNLQQWKQFFFLHVPILHWLLTYKKGYILSDVVAGITIGIMQVAQGWYTERVSLYDKPTSCRSHVMLLLRSSYSIVFA